MAGPVGAAIDGLVLRLVDYGEADRIGSLLTAERGRLEIRFPGARRSRRRFGGLDLLVLVRVELAPGRDPLRAASVELRREFPGLRSNLPANALASYAIELLRKASQEEHEAADLLRLGTAALESLGAAQAPGQGWARAFELKLLHVLGARPSLRACAVTGEPAAPGMLWSAEVGGILSQSAAREDRAALPIDLETVRLLDRALHTPLAEQDSVPWTDASARGARDALRSFLAHHVGAPGKARAMLEQLVPLVLLLALLPACPAGVPESVRVQGYLFDDPVPDPAVDRAVDGASGIAWDDAGEELGEATNPFSGSPGWYRFEGLPPKASLHLVFEPPRDGGFVTTVVSGRSAPNDLFVDAGVFHLWPTAEVDVWRDDWAGRVAIPAFSDSVQDGGIVRGQLADPENHLGLRVVLAPPNGAPVEAVYTDAEGLPSDGEGTSEHGGFLAVGLPEGPVEVVLFDGDAPVGDSFVSRVAEDGVTSLVGLEVVP